MQEERTTESALQSVSRYENFIDLRLKRDLEKNIRAREEVYEELSK